jgi:hypothetical protein
MNPRGAFAAGVFVGIALTSSAGVVFWLVRKPNLSSTTAQVPPTRASEGIRAESTTAAPSASANAERSAAAPEPGDAGAEEDGGKAAQLDVVDPQHVDPLDLFARAKALVLKVEKRAKLTRIVAPELADDGTVDLTKERPIDYRFEYAYVDARLPHGKNTFKGHLIVAASSRGLKLSQVPANADAKMSDHTPPDPKCSLKSAWTAVSTTSVPDARSARVVYEFDGRARTGVWRFSFGRGTGDRVADGISCALLSATPPSADPAAPSKGR